MDLMEQIYEKAKENPQRVIFPEATEEKILQAAYEAQNAGYCKATLIGVPEEIKAAAEQFGVDISGMEIYDNTDEAANEKAFERYIAEYSDMLSLKALKVLALTLVFLLLRMVMLIYTGAMDVVQN